MDDAKEKSHVLRVVKTRYLDEEQHDELTLRVMIWLCRDFSLRSMN
jgi:hypothetical protein